MHGNPARPAKRGSGVGENGLNGLNGGGVYVCVCEGKEEYESFLGRTSVCGLIIPFPIPYPLLFYIGIYFL